MKYILSNRKIKLCFLTAFLLGCFVGYGISSDFEALYLYKFSYYTTIYTLLVLVIYSSYIINHERRSTAFLFRRKSFSRHFIELFKKEGILSTLLFLIMHIPILILNGQAFFQSWKVILLVLCNYIFISFLFLTVIKLLDIRIKNEKISSGIVFILWGILHVLEEEIHFSLITSCGFEFKNIFRIPLVYSPYIIIAIFFIFIILVLCSSIVLLEMQKDYFLEVNDCD